MKKHSKSNALNTLRIYTVISILAVLTTLVVLILKNNISLTKNTLGVSSNIYYVSPNGNDTGSGSQSTPLKTFTKAQTLAVSGDTIHILEGTYKSTLEVTKNGLTIIGHKAVIDAAGLHKAIFIRANDINMSGFEAIHSNSHAVYIEGQNVNFSDSVVHDAVYENRNSNGYPANKTFGSGISVKNPAKNVVINKVKVYNVYGEGIDVNAADTVKVTNSIVYDTYSIGIYIDNSKYVTLEKNFVYCTGNPHFKRNGEDMVGYSMAIENVEKAFPGWGAQLHDIRIVNNISYGCRGMTFWGSQLGDGLKNAYIAYNSILKVPNNSSIWINSQPKNTNIQINNNLFGTTITTGGNATYSNNLTNVTFTTNDYSNPNSIKPTNGANKGILTNSVVTDFADNPRGNTPDIGAWEIDSSIPNTTSTPTPTITPITTKSKNRPPVNKIAWRKQKTNVNTQYASEFSATDQDLTDQLSMTITGLPEGISIKSCDKKIVRKKQEISCLTTGSSNSKGKYRVIVKTVDDQGGQDTDIIILNVI